MHAANVLLFVGGVLGFSLIWNQPVSAFSEVPYPKSDVAIIIVDHGSRRALANEMLLQVVDRFKARSKYSIVEPAHMELAEPSISTAYRRCVERGATEIVWGRHVQEDIPTILAEAAAQFPHTHFRLTEPVGAQDQIIDLIANSISQAHGQE